MGKGRITIKRIALLLVPLLMVITCITVYLINPIFVDQTTVSPSGLNNYFDTRNFTINPMTILEEINQGETNVFVLMSITPEAYEKLHSNPLPWEQSDYLRIADALHRYTWGETLDDWKLYNMQFYGDCGHEPVGFDLFKVTYFKDVGSMQYTAHEIDIFPLYGGASTGGGTDFPKPLFGWKSINLDNFQITADDALQIAEENGGKAARLSVANECSIYVWLANAKQLWSVIYSTRESSFVFEMDINPYTGKFKVID
jgi:hypothetical protein